MSEEIFVPILKKVYFFIGIFFLLAIIKLILQSSWFKGKVGETSVKLTFNLWLDKKVYHVINNVILPTDSGTTQIDHIIVSTYGVFVIETKNMNGWIFGSEKQKIWTQSLYGNSYKFQNPIHQNFKHIKTLQSLLNLNEYQIYSVIVFVGKCTFKTKMPENVTLDIDGCLRFIKSKKKQVIPEKEIEEIIKKIENFRLPDSIKTNLQHIKNVDNIIREKKK